MPLAEAPSPLDGLASAAATLLGIEIFVIILLVAAIVVLLAWGMHWVHDHAVPPIRQYLPQVINALNVTDRSAGRVIDMVALVYSRQRGFDAAIRRFAQALGAALQEIFAAQAQSQSDSPPASPDSTTTGAPPPAE